MSEELLLLAIDFRVDNRLVPWDELIGSDTLLTELGYALTRSGPWPLRTSAEIRQELLRMHERWKKKCSKSASYPEWATRPPFFWVYESEDEDDIFMPSVLGKSSSSSKGKNTSSSKGKSSSSSKGKSSSSSKGKSSSSS
jgi:uncharacterized membrane protein YgcG